MNDVKLLQHTTKSTTQTFFSLSGKVIVRKNVSCSEIVGVYSRSQHGGKNDGVTSYFFNSEQSTMTFPESSAPKGIATLVIKIFCHDKNLSK